MIQSWKLHSSPPPPTPPITKLPLLKPKKPPPPLPHFSTPLFKPSLEFLRALFLLVCKRVEAE